jgi:hypothetical protein
VHHQVAHGHRPLRIDDPLRAVLVPLADLQVAPLRDVAGHRVVELEQPALVQGQQRDPGDRLGHRVDAPDRALLDGPVPFEVPEPERPEITHVAVPGHDDLATGDAPGVDVALCPVVCVGERPGTRYLHDRAFRIRKIP